MLLSQRQRATLLLLLALGLVAGSILFPRLSLSQIEIGGGGGGSCAGDHAQDCNPIGPQIFSGYAWNSQFGWISFDSSDFDTSTHGVWLSPTDYWDNPSQPYTGLTPNRNMTGRSGDDFSVPGYAWSDHIGWIRFGGTFSDYPSAVDNFGARLDDQDPNQYLNIDGWARACAVFQSGCSGALKADKYRGGWDGWFKMSGVAVGTGDPYTSVLDYPNGTDNAPSGFVSGSAAWGGNELGWTKWCDEDAPEGAPYCVRLGDPEVVQPLTAQCTTSPGGANPSETIVVGTNDSVDMTWEGSITGEIEWPVQYEWRWNWGTGEDYIETPGYASDDPVFVGNEYPYAEQLHISCPSDEGVEQIGTFTVFDNGGNSDSCQLTRTYDCFGVPPDGNTGDPEINVTPPVNSDIYITSQPSGLSAISTGTSFHNNGDDLEGEEFRLTILSTNSLSGSNRDLSQLDGVDCYLGADPAGQDTVFGPCNTGTYLEFPSGGDAYFYVKVDNTSSRADLLRYSPYEVVIGPANGPATSTVSVKVHYKAGIINY